MIVAASAGADIITETSLKAALDLDWDDPEHCAYNAVSNAPFLVSGQEHHRYRLLQKLPDSIFKDGGYDSIFAKHEFHPVESDDDSGAGIFRRQCT